MPEINIEQLRRRMLIIAKMGEGRHADGYVPAAFFTHAKDDHGRPDRLSDDAAIEELGWLVATGLLDERNLPSLGGDKRSFRHRAFRLSRKGWLLWLEEIQPIPGVADDRLEG